MRAQLWRVPAFWSNVIQGMAGAMGSRMSSSASAAWQGNAGGGALFAPAPANAWDVLREKAGSTETGKRLLSERAERERGEGPTHTDNKLRLFGAKESDVRVTFYRDTAAWCPYCQKTWLLLEEKRIPHRIEKINMRSYGDKPREFLAKVPRGLLPAIEIDGRMMTESLEIMQTLDRMFPTENNMVPWDDDAALKKANILMSLERELFGAWCSFVFQPGDRAQRMFEGTMDRVDAALKETQGPWFLGGNAPTIVDLQYVSHIERMLASCLYWKGLKIRGSGRWTGIDKWFEEFEKRQSYLATKGDYYTHVTDIPPQYGPGQSIPAGEPFRPRIDGRQGWNLPLDELSEKDIEPVLPFWNPGEEGARHEACLKIAESGSKVAKFACRATGTDVGKWRAEGGGSRSDLADPYAEPDPRFIDDVETALRHITCGLLDGHEAATSGLKSAMQDAPDGRRKAVVASLDYLRLRVSVPRDMSYPAARQFRAHIQWAMDIIAGSK